jgi:hypothetical protein
MHFSPIILTHFATRFAGRRWGDELMSETEMCTREWGGKGGNRKLMKVGFAAYFIAIVVATTGRATVILLSHCLQDALGLKEEWRHDPIGVGVVLTLCFWAIKWKGWKRIGEAEVRDGARPGMKFLLTMFRWVILMPVLIGGIYNVVVLRKDIALGALSWMIWRSGFVLMYAAVCWCGWGGVEGTKTAWRFWIRGEEDDERADGPAGGDDALGVGDSYWKTLAEQVGRFHETVMLFVTKGKAPKSTEEDAVRLTGRAIWGAAYGWIGAVLAPWVFNTFTMKFSQDITVVAAVMRLPISIPDPVLVQRAFAFTTLIVLIGECTTWTRVWAIMERLAKDELFLEGKKLVEYMDNGRGKGEGENQGGKPKQD